MYSVFDTPLMQQVRREAYGEDIGQHSWVTADELRSDLERLTLTHSSKLLDVGCGPGGPLVFAVRASGCSGTGLDMSTAALASALERARAAAVEERIRLLECDLNLPLPFEAGSFDAIMSLDVVLHVRNRTALFKEIARVLLLTGRFLFTDAGVISGAISSDEVARRSANGYTQFVPPGKNEALLEAAGFQIIASEDRTSLALRTAHGRLRAMRAERPALVTLLGVDAFEQHEHYLATVVELSERQALSRIMYLVELTAR